MRVLVTRPQPAAARTAALLARRGHDAVVAPLMSVRASGEAPPHESYDAVVLTSANALVALDALPRAVQIIAVGERSAAEARAAGFSDVRAAGGDRHALARFVAQALAPSRRLLVAVGRDRKEDIGTLLGAAGHRPILWTAYVAESAKVLPEQAAQALARSELDAILHYSRRSAAIVVRLAREAGLETALLTRRHFCLSADVASALVQAGARRLATATMPDEEHLIAALDQSP